MNKVLIIKTGHSELLEKEDHLGVSLGDVFRTTVLLHIFKKYKVYWLTSAQAAPLLKKLANVQVVLWEQRHTLNGMHFLLSVNLEKGDAFCRHHLTVSANEKKGFYSENGSIKIHGGHKDILHLMQDIDFRQQSAKSVQHILYEMVSKKWRGESYVLSHPQKSERYDVGFNFHVGTKLPSKAWSLENWQKLEELLYGFQVSWQRGTRNLKEYIQWIQTCRILVTCDSLGLHLALALGKKVVSLFGPTFPQEICMDKYNVKVISPKKCECMHYFKKHCEQPIKCIDAITPEIVYEKIILLLGGKHGDRRHSYSTSNASAKSKKNPAS